MACDNEKNNAIAAGLATVAACATVETGIGVIACAAAYYNYINTLTALDDCLVKNGHASISDEINQGWAEYQALNDAAQAAGVTT
jgi:hypothetical protein